MKSMIENYVNGNLTTAKKQAKRHGLMAIVNYLKDEWGHGTEAALAIAAFLKGQGSFQAACDAEHAEKAGA